MKKLIPVLSLVLILFACRKTEQTGQTESGAAKHDVKFIVSDFNVGKETLSASGTKATMAAGDVLSDYADYLHCSIYNEEGFLVWYVNQKRDDKDFGTIASRLGNGNYSVVIAAAKNNPLSFTLDSPAPYSVLRFSSGRPDGNFNDTFHKTFKITVTDQPLTQAIKLSRLVGAFDVVFTDPIPADIAKVTVTLYSESHTLTLDGTYYSRNTPSSYEYVLTAADAGKTNKTFSGYVIGTDWELLYEIKAYNSKNVLVAQKSIPSIKVAKGQRVAIAGSFFTPANMKITNGLTEGNATSTGWSFTNTSM
jgi:hypothetical protein